ncbi:tetratricopeptide repeat protein [Scytonema sp. PCC 10023]|uniref:tetratricopeptide repeat protein n=1 Tax=Scytonema sp. PCC 10023 TaxID=1680591 RepID=UPI0039C6CEE4
MTKAFWQWFNQGIDLANLGKFEEAIASFDEALKIKPAQPEAWYERGTALASLERFEEAISYLDKSIEINPNHELAWRNKANALEKLGRYEEALQSYERALKVNPNWHNFWYWRGIWLCFYFHKYEDAIECFDKAIELQSEDYLYWHGRGFTLLKLKKYDDALVSFEKVLELNPNYEAAWYWRGFTLGFLYKYEEAIQSFEKAIDLKNDYFESWYIRGLYLQDLQKYEQAFASYDQAVKIKPDDHEAWYHRGVTLAALEGYEEAVASYNKVIEIKSDYEEVWLSLGIALGNLERYEEAVASYDKAIEINPNFHEAWYNRGIILCDKLGRYEEAIASNNEALKLKPDFHEAWYNRGIALNKWGQFSEAIASFEEVIKLKPDDHRAWNSRGSALCDLGWYEDAIASYDQALKFKPDYYTAWYHRGVALGYLGRYEDAIASYDQALKFKPDYYTAWNNRGSALDNLGQCEDAIASYDQVLKFKPDYYTAWYNRGVALVNLGQREEAVASYDKALELKPDDYNTWINRGLAVANIVETGKNPTGLFILPVITSYPDLAITFKNQDLNEGGRQGQFASYEEGLKHCPQETHLEGWGKLHQAIGNAHYLWGCRDDNPYPHWRRAFKSYQNALKTLTQFPEAHLELLRDLIRCLSALGHTSEAEELQRRATDILQNLLKDTPSPGRKQQLALRFVGFQQLTVDLAVQSGNWCAALEVAEQGKNACLSWLLYSLGDEISSPNYLEIQKLLNPTTAIIYWHISPNALNTFLLKHNAPSPIVLSPQISANSLEENQASDEQLPITVKRNREFAAWVQNWNKQYANYREGKDNQEAGQATWRDRLPEELEELGKILDINAIVNAILPEGVANANAPDSPTSTIQNLILIPHQDLHRFPLHTLFPEQFTITYLPSAKIGLSLRDQVNESENIDTSKQLLSVEAPDSADIIQEKKFEELRHAEIESATISQMFANPHRLAGSDATKENVEKALAFEYKFFHFTGHGTYNFYNPKKSALALSNTQRLTLEDILQLPLSNCQMVSLSACETAITGSQTITTEYVGLVSGFISKGVTNVVSTLWSVESMSSALFMIEFYRQPDWNTAPAVALKRTQMWLRNVTYSELVNWYKQRAEEIAEKDFICAEDLLDEAAIIEDDPVKINTTIPPYAHPYYWASFIITGKIHS